MSCDPDSVLGAELVGRIRAWLRHRQELWRQEDSGEYPAPGVWHSSDDDAIYIVEAIADLFGIHLDEEVSGA